jgi:hypothetical protein
VIQVGDRPARVKKAALAVQSAAQAFQQRQLPATGQRGMPSGAGRPLNHGALGAYGADPMAKLAQALDRLARETADAFRPPQGPVGHTGGIRRDNGGTNASTAPGGTVGTFRPMTMLGLDWLAPYTEPMDIPLPPRFLPVAVIAARITDPSNTERYFRSGVSCDWQTSSTPNTLTLRSIDGMTVNPLDPTPLHYVFIYYGSQL